MKFNKKPRKNGFSMQTDRLKQSYFNDHPLSNTKSICDIMHLQLIRNFFKKCMLTLDNMGNKAYKGNKY